MKEEEKFDKERSLCREWRDRRDGLGYKGSAAQTGRLWVRTMPFPFSLLRSHLLSLDYKMFVCVGGGGRGLRCRGLRGCGGGA